LLAVYNCLSARLSGVGKTRSDSYEGTRELLALATANQASKIPSELATRSRKEGQENWDFSLNLLLEKCMPTRAFIVR